MRQEVVALFEAVVDRPQAERDAYYTSQQVPDALRDEVEALLLDLSNAIRPEGDDTIRPLEESGVVPATGSPGIPQTIGRFVITRVLGRGGMGEVFLARDPVLDRAVAIKLIGGEFDDAVARRRLIREARAAGRLHHPNIVTVFEAGEHESRPYIAMEYVTGETLGKLIRRRAPLSLRRRLDMIDGAAAGLAHAHREGVVHLDIKPDNLMRDDTGVVKVLDFGVSRVMQSETLVTGQIVGTLRYMSPEQIQGLSLDHRSDVFSLGCALFELVTYQHAYEGSPSDIITQITSGPVPRLLDVSPRLDSRLDSIVRRAMALEPANRYADLEAMRAELAEVRAAIDPAEDESASMPLGVVEGKPPGRVASGSRSSARQTVRRSLPTITAGVAGAVLAGTLAFLAWRGGTTTIEISPPATSTPAPVPPPEPARTPPVELPPPVQPGDDIWKRLASGDRAGVLERLGSAGRGRAANPALAGAVVDTIRSNVMRSKEAAASARNGAGADLYREGDEQLSRAQQLAATGQTVESVRAFWQAADLFAKSLTVPGRATASAPPPSPPVTPAEPVPSAASASKPETETVAPPPPGPSPARPEASQPPAAAASPPPKAPSDDDAIHETLRRYDAAYEAMSIDAVRRVYPSLAGGQVEQLRQTFEGMKSYQMDIRNVRVTVTNDTATAQGTLARRMVPRVGAPVIDERNAEFRLRRAGGAWEIADVAVR